MRWNNVLAFIACVNAFELQNRGFGPLPIISSKRLWACRHPLSRLRGQ